MGGDGLQYVQVNEGGRLVGWLPLAVLLVRNNGAEGGFGCQVKGPDGADVQVLMDASSSDTEALAHDQAQLAAAIQASLQSSTEPCALYGEVKCG